MFRFGPFELDEKRFELRRGSQVVPVQRKVMEAVLYLVRERDRLITKEEMKANVWAGAAVTDAAVHRVMMVARRLLSEARGSPIRTVHGKGYRFVGEVELGPISTKDKHVILSTQEMPGPPPSSRRREASPFIGRKRELSLLRRAMARTKGGRGGIVLLAGEPGIGKTRLLQASEELARAEGCEVWLGRAWEAGGAPAFWPWTEAMRCGLRLRGSNALETLLGDESADLQALLPGWFRAADSYSSDRPPDDGASTRFRVFDLLTRLVFAAAETVPVVLMLDDLHAADEATVLLTRFMSQTLGQRQVLLVGAYRSREAEDNKPLTTFITGPHNSAEYVTLSGLDPQESAELLRGLLGFWVSERQASTVCEMAAGNPFLIQEFGRSAASLDDLVGRLSLVPLPIPERAAKCIRERVSRLSNEVQGTLEIASAIGRSFWLEELVAIANKGSEASKGLELLERAWMDGLVELDPLTPGAFRFSHQLVRDTIYGDIAPTRRFELHDATAKVLEHRLLHDTDVVFQIAHHNLVAVPLHGTAQALRWACEAGNHAMRQLAYEQAAEQFATMVRLLESTSAAPSALPEALLLLGEAQAMAGQLSLAIDAFQRVIAAGDASEDFALVGRGALGWFRAVDCGYLSHPQLEKHLSDALACSDTSQSLRAELAVALACCSALSKPLAERQRLFEEGLELAADVPTSATVASALAYSMTANFFWDSPRRGCELAAKVVANAKSSRNTHARLHAHLWRGCHQLQLGRTDELALEMAEHERLAQRVRHPFHLYAIDLFRVCRHQMAGELREAETLARQASPKGERAAGVGATLFFGLQLLTTIWERGPKGTEHLEREVRALIEGLKAVGVMHPLFPVFLTRCDLERGLESDVRCRLEELAPRGNWDWPADDTLVPSACQMAIIAASLGEQDIARSVYRRLLPLAGTHTVACCFGAYWGPISYYLGIAAATFGDLTQAHQYLEQAHAEANRVGARTYQAWSDYAIARLLLRDGAPNQRVEIERRLRDSGDVARRLELGKLSEKVDLAQKQLQSLRAGRGSARSRSRT